MPQESLLLLWNQKQMVDRIIKLFENARIEVLAFLSAYTLTITTDDERFQIPKREARKRGVRLRYITEITKDNLEYCKRQLDMVDELRHLNKIKGNFLMSEREFMASQEVSPRHPITDGFYSNAKQVVKLKEYIFETLWDNSIPAAERIEQLEASAASEIPSKSDYHYHNTVEEQRQQKRIIDRFYVCPQCHSTYIYSDEARAHQIETGHRKAKEFPIFD